MIDILYTLGGGSRWRDNELRYSLRSIEKHLSNYRDVYIVAKPITRPEWLTNVIYVDCEDKLPYYKEQNIFHKVCRGCEVATLSDNFLFFNDDHFLLQDFNAETFPYFYKCELHHSLTKRVWEGKYKRAMSNTYNELTQRSFLALNYDTHTPIIYNKGQMLSLKQLYNWETYDVGFILKSLYANTFNVLGVHEYDCKLDDIMTSYMIRESIQGKKVFSIADLVLQPTPEELERVMLELYPRPSKFELS